MLKKFWWRQNTERGKVLWVTTNQMDMAKREGGLEFKDLRRFNLAMLTKQS